MRLFRGVLPTRPTGVTRRCRESTPCAVPSSPPPRRPRPAAAGQPRTRGRRTRVQVRLLGDSPYGDEQRAAFPALVDAVNADPVVRLVLHAGDIKNGQSPCDDAMFADRAALNGTFADPFVLTPGDNEWTDCHRVTAGSFVPTERLDALRVTMFPTIGWTLGQRRSSVLSQATIDPRHRPYRENVIFWRSQVVSATVHAVGSQNEHRYEVEPGYAGVPNLTRLETFGNTTTEWLHVTVQPRPAAVFTWVPRKL